MGKIRRDDNCLVNPIILFVLILAFSIILFITDDIGYYIMMVISMFLTLTFSLKQFIKQLATVLILIIVGKTLTITDLGIGGNAILGLVEIVLKLFPIFVIGGILVNTSPLKMMSSLKFLHIPNVFALSIVIGMKFISEMGLRIKEIKNGMKVRGLRLSPLHPVRSFELYFIPLIYKCLQVSETLTSSIISKGAEYRGERTNYHKITFKFFDIVFLLLAIFLLWRSI